MAIRPDPIYCIKRFKVGTWVYSLSDGIYWTPAYVHHVYPDGKALLIEPDNDEASYTIARVEYGYMAHTDFVAQVQRALPSKDKVGRIREAWDMWMANPKGIYEELIKQWNEVG